MHVGAAEERELGIGPHLRRQLVELRRRDVRRVADNEVHGSEKIGRQRIEQIALHDGHLQPELRRVVPGQLARIRRHVGGPHRRPGPFVLHGEGDGAGPGPDVHHHRVPYVVDER